MFDTVLVANRGEIAVRVIRTLRALGVRSVAVYADPDAQARHVREADVAVRIGPAAAADSYLSIERILAAAQRSGVEAIHPGYGFLAENAAFAAACAQAGVVFVGPPVRAIQAMGDKIRARRAVSAAGVPVLPGLGAPGRSDAEVAAAAREVGFPVLLKPSAGGGGKGMRLVREAGALVDQIGSARRESRAAFGDDTLLVERYVERPRHVEIQVLADQHGTVLHLGERECSLQRRHQKIIEESPSPLLDGPTRARMGAAAVAAARSVGYTGAGTVEFIVPAEAPAEFFFLEMNTRLQVEHPVTEAVTGLDLVEWQLRVAAGEPLGFGQPDVRFRGHAIEARVYAEDPARGFLPTGGRVLALHEPERPDIRVDSSLVQGLEVSSNYDPMLAKVIAWGPDRETAHRRLDSALAGTVLLGVTTNIAFLRALLADADVRAGRLDTGLIERRLDALTGGDVPAEVLAAAGLARLLALEPDGPVRDPWELPGGWRVGEPAWASWQIRVPGRDAVQVRVRGRAHDAEVAVGDGPPVRASAHWANDAAHWANNAARWPGDGQLAVSYAGRTARYALAWDGAALWLGRDGHAWPLTEVDRLAAARRDTGRAAGGTVRSPMPGTVLAVRVVEGEKVAAGAPLVVVEAMKMEHTLTAPIDGVLTAVPARVGAQVALDEVLAVLSPVDVLSPTDGSGTDGTGVSR